MKKIKLLTGLAALTTLSGGIALAATSCSGNNEDNKKLDSNLLITFNYDDSDVVSPKETVTWSFNISYNSNPTSLKKLEVTSSNTNVATVEVPYQNKQEFKITGVNNGTTWITVKVTDENDHYNELTHEVYVAGEAVSEDQNYIGTIYGRFAIDDEVNQDDINALVPNYNKQIIIAGAAISPEILTELNIVTTNGRVLNLPIGFLKGCTSLKKLNLSGIKTTSIQDTYLARPVLGEFSVNRLRELVVPELVANAPTEEIIVTDFLNCDAGMPSLTKIDLTGFANVKRIKGWWFCNNCTALTDINLEVMSKLVEIGVAFMHGCSALENVNISTWTKLQVIRNTFMYGCTSLQSLDMTNLTSLKVIGGEFLKNCSSLTTFKFPGTAAQSSALESIGYDTEYNEWGKVFGQFMYGCSSLKSIDFSTLNPDNFDVTRYVIDADAEFRHGEECPKQSIYLEPVDTTESDRISYLFFGCENLEEINFGTLDSGSFGYGTGVVNYSSFYTTKPFETKEDAWAYMEDTSEKGIKYSGWNNDQLVSESDSLFAPATETTVQKIGNYWYARKWTLVSSKMVVAPYDYYPINGVWDSENNTFEVDKLANGETAQLFFYLTDPITSGTWTVVDSSTGSQITGASFDIDTYNNRIGVLTVDHTVDVSTPQSWTIKYDGDVPMEDYTLNVKEGSVRIAAEYKYNDDANFEPIKNGAQIGLYYNQTKVKYTVKNTDVAEDNIQIVSCVNIGTLEQATTTGHKNEATWTYTYSGSDPIEPAELFLVAAFDTTKPSDLPFITFSWYRDDGRSVPLNWDTSLITCDQNNSFVPTIVETKGGKNYSAEGTWTNPSSTEVKTLALDIPAATQNLYEVKVYSVYNSSGTWTNEKATSGTPLGNNLTPTFPSRTTGPNIPPTTFKTTGTSAATTSVIVVYNYSYDSSSNDVNYHRNYVIFVKNTN